MLGVKIKRNGKQKSRVFVGRRESVKSFDVCLAFPTVFFNFFTETGL